jgi:Type II secretion system (T2SS), protein E, N-terminal domain
MAKLGQLLVARGWITVQQLNRALHNQSVVGGRLGTCLIEIDALTEDYLLKGLSEQLGVPSATIDDLRKIPEEVLALVPDKLARRCRAVPFRLEGSRLDLAMIDARNLSCQDEIAFATGKRVKVHVAHELRILEALERHYREESPSRFSLLVERLNRARYFWEKSGEPAESAATLAAPLNDLLGNRPAKMQPPPPLPEPPRAARPPVVPRPVVVAPPPAPVAVTAAEATAAPRAAAAPRPLTIPLTEEERTALAPVPVAAPPAPAPAPVPAPAPARPEPLPQLSTFEEVEKAFEATMDRERVGRIVLAFLARSYRRAALFQVGRDRVSAWMAQGEINLEQFETFSASFDQPSVFLNLRQGTAFYIGPMPPMPAHRQLAGAWGGELPRDCVLLPVRMKDRLVAVIYADGAGKGLSGIDLPQMQRLASSTAAALQRGILHKKKGEPGV